MKALQFNSPGPGPSTPSLGRELGRRTQENAEGYEEDTATPWHIAAVRSTDGIVFLTLERSREAITRRTAEYVREQAHTKLWPIHAERVRELLNAGRTSEAIDLYFAKVGQRWDPEFLHIETINPPTN